jgi:glycosyltransferase involved in cell wall biosynthesis
MRVLFALPGFHRIDRGAEVALISVAKEIAKSGDTVTLLGSGQERTGLPYRFVHVASMSRDHFGSFPSLPVLRNDCSYEELTFVPDLLRKYRPSDYDVTVTCSYPFTNWVLRRPTIRGRRPPHIFVTENGDWPAYSRQSEYRFFGCEGLICTNPDFYERNRTRWHCQLIPNGIDCERFKPGAIQRQHFGLPTDKLIVLMVSALIPAKRVDIGIEAVSRIPDAHLVVAGNGPIRQAIEATAANSLPGRFTLLSVPAEQMPPLYQSADVFLHLSKDESFGNVFLEAMACGLPVVAHDSPRVRWIVGDNQFLIDSDNSASITAAIKAASNAPNAGLQEGISRAASFTWPRIGKLYREFLHKIAG